jgi:hypothetical protein
VSDGLKRFSAPELFVVIFKRSFCYIRWNGGERGVACRIIWPNSRVIGLIPMIKFAAAYQGFFESIKRGLFVTHSAVLIVLFAIILVSEFLMTSLHFFRKKNWA